MKCITFGSDTAHNRQRELLQTSGLKDKAARTQQQHTLETLPEAPGPGGQRTLHCRALQNLFFIKPLPLRTGDVADSLKQAQRLRPNEKMGFVPIEQDQVMARELCKTYISTCQ